MLGLPLDSWLLIAASTFLGPMLVLRFLLVQRKHGTELDRGPHPGPDPESDP